MMDKAHLPFFASAMWEGAAGVGRTGGSTAAQARRGLAIGWRPDGPRLVYRIALIEDGAAWAAPLHETDDEREALKVWRDCADQFGLPRFIERAPDDYVMVEAALGALTIRARKPRRRGSPLIGRRPRMALRRTVGDAPPALHSADAEIIART